MESLSVPIYYVLSRQLLQEDIDATARLLSITPCHYGIVSKFDDCPLAQNFSQEQLLADSDDASLSLAKELSMRTGYPVLVIGQAAPLTAVYEDGSSEQIHVGAVR